jgi:hypothetical protein
MNQSKELLIAQVNNMTDQDADQLLELFTELSNHDLRGALSALKIDTNSMDSARPQEWSDRMREQSIDPRGYFWSYKEDRIWGRPFNAHTAIVDSLMNLAAGWHNRRTSELPA